MKNQNKILLSFSVALLMGATGAFAADPVVTLPTIASQAYVDTALSAKANKATTIAGYGITDAYTKDQVDTALAAKVNEADIVTNVRTIDSASNDYIPTELAVATVVNGLTGGNGTVAQQIASAIGNIGSHTVDNETVGNTVEYALGLKADKSDTYTKSQVDTALAAKANAATTYTKTETDTLLAAKQGTLTAGDNITIENGTISATDTTYTAGDNIAIENGAISATYTAGSNITITNGVIAATDTTYSTGTAGTAGLTKLYTATGANTDGTMTQNAITTALNGKQESLPDTASGCADGYCLLLTDANGNYEWVGVALAPAP